MSYAMQRESLPALRLADICPRWKTQVQLVSFGRLGHDGKTV
jgi:hypothetical protein